MSMADFRAKRPRSHLGAEQEEPDQPGHAGALRPVEYGPGKTEKPQYETDDTGCNKLGEAYRFFLGRSYDDYRP